MLKYTLKSDFILNENTIHAIVTHIFGKDSKDSYKVIRNGKFMTLITNKNIESFSYGFDRGVNNIKVVDVSSYEQKIKSEMVELSGVVSYSKTLTKTIEKNGKKVNKLRIVSFKETMKNELESFIKQKLGITTDDVRVSAIPTVCISNNKRIHDAFEIVVKGKVVDEELVNSLFYNQVGQAKSYGFGSINIKEL